MEILNFFNFSIFQSFNFSILLMWLLLAFLSAKLLGFYDSFKKKSLKVNAVITVLFLNKLFSHPSGAKIICIDFSSIYCSFFNHSST